MVRLFLTILVLAVVSPAWAEPQFPPGMRVGLEPVRDLKLAAGGTGFQDTDRNVSVVIAEMPPAAFEGLQKAIFGPAPAGVTRVARETFPFRDGIGYLHSARAIENGVPVYHWVLLAAQVVADGPGQQLVTVINVSVPEAVRDIYTDEAVRQMLASVTFRPTPIEERLGLVPFKLGDLAGLRVIQVQPEGIVLTDGPSDDIGAQPYVIVTIGRVAPEQSNDRQRFARDLLLAAPLRELTIQSGEEMRIGGRPGHEIRARATNELGNTVDVVQWIKFRGGAYLRIIAASPREQWDQMFNRFRAVRDGVDLR